MLSTARHLAAEPPPGLRVLVVATGSEESFQEGMQAFWARHGAELSPETTTVINFESVGSPELLVLEGEGMLGVVDYTSELRELAAACAEEIGVRTRRGLRLRNATDGLIPLKLGYPTLTLSSVDEFKAPTNYHWPTDVPGNVHYETVDQAARTVVAVVESLAGS
ncbi:MAG: M28 family metallopeptidase [Solirubrobacterales bacterium]